jgi:hypothetical protein
MPKYLERCDKNVVLTLMELTQEPTHTQIGCQLVFMELAQDLEPEKKVSNTY